SNQRPSAYKAEPLPLRYGRKRVETCRRSCVSSLPPFPLTTTPGRIRTCINALRRRVHYPLCYGGVQSPPRAIGSEPRESGNVSRSLTWISFTTTAFDASPRKSDITTLPVAARPTPSVPPVAFMPNQQPLTPIRYPNTNVFRTAGITSRSFRTPSEAF